MDYQTVINALRDRARKFASLDSQPDADLGDMAIDIGAGFVPGLGTAQAGRDFERARREGDKLGMGLAGIGMVPVVGGVTKGISALRKAKQGAEAATDAAPSLRQVLEQVAAKSDDVGYDRAKIAKQYPDTAPPVLAKDPKTGKEFLQKQNSAEAMAVEKVRKAAQKDIDKGNYTPYFDVSKREYVDPKNYPLQGATITDALPKKQATIDKWKQEFDTPEVRENLKAAFLRGNKDPLTKDWYATGQLEKQFVKEYGDKLGRSEYKEAFPVAMAATTGGADPTSNLLMSYYGNFLRKGGQEMPKAAYEMPYPIGGRYASGNMDMYDKVINQGAGLTTDTPKRFNFAADFMGHLDRPTIDEQMSGLYKPGMVVPPGDSYGVMEQVLNDVAKTQGVTPVNFQEVSWAGAKGTAGKPMIQHINEAIERTARVTGKTPEEVVRDSLVRRTHPLYGVGAAGVAGVGAASMMGQEEMQ